MDHKKSALFLCATLVLSGCTANPPPPAAPVGDDATVKLAETASAISQSLTNLDAIEKNSAPPINNKLLPYPTSNDMMQPVSVDWSGPIEPLLRRIAGLCNYSLRVIGMSPAIPVLVTISAKNTPVGYVIRDANFQAMSKASVLVYPGIHVIELRYGKS